MIPNPCIEIQTSPVARPSVPPWFAEVVIIAQHLATKGLLDAFAHQGPLVRSCFGCYEPLDYLALLVGYARSRGTDVSGFRFCAWHPSRKHLWLCLGAVRCRIDPA